jgi:hypothetical protein
MIDEDRWFAQDLAALSPSEEGDPPPLNRPSRGARLRQGAVNLPTGGRAKTGRFPLALRGDAQFGDRAPHDDRLGSQRSIVG